MGKQRKNGMGKHQEPVGGTVGRRYLGNSHLERLCRRLDIEEEAFLEVQVRHCQKRGGP